MSIGTKMLSAGKITALALSFLTVLPLPALAVLQGAENTSQTKAAEASAPFAKLSSKAGAFNKTKPETPEALWDSHRYASFFGDFNGDQKPDLLLQAREIDDEHKWLNNVNDEYQAARNATAMSSFPINWLAREADIIVGNFNHDAFDDIAIFVREANQLVIAFGDADVPFQKIELVNSTVLPVFLHGEAPIDITGDFNGDGLTDLFLQVSGQSPYSEFSSYGSDREAQISSNENISHQILLFNENNLNFEQGQTITHPSSDLNDKQHHFYFADFNNDGIDDIFAQAMNDGESHYYLASDLGAAEIFSNNSAVVLPADFAGYPWNASEHTTNLIDIDLDGVPEMIRMANSPLIFNLDGELVVDESIRIVEDSACKLLVYHVGAGVHQRGCESKRAFDISVATNPTEENNNIPAFIDLSNHPILGEQGAADTQSGAPSAMGNISSSVGQHPEVGTSSRISWPRVQRAIIYQLQEKAPGRSWKLVHHGADNYRGRGFPKVGNYRYRARACNMASGSQTCNTYSNIYLIYAYGTPSAPTNVTKNRSYIFFGETFSINWTRAKGIIGTGGYYEFQEKKPGSSSYTYHSSTRSGHYTYHNITPNKSAGLYRYRFKACNNRNRCSAWSTININVWASAENYPVTGDVLLSGGEYLGSTLQSTHTLKDNNGLGELSYQWLQNGANISGATTSSLTLTSSQVGKKISLRVSFIDDDGFAESKDSAQTAAISAVAPATVSIKWTPSSVRQGESSQLIWASQHATQCKLNGSESVATSGSKAPETITSIKTASITCTGASGSSTAEATVTIATHPKNVTYLHTDALGSVVAESR
ncbi:FG-GAP-like repeat-containing protein [Glaciecola siphonariae]|uniref:FG-GAP-like repeat-containing protein n=1 Tax=Glaciecola siphonariae TaxID=521012 RepID=A0ABV9LXJ9_9ALTE